MSDLYNEVTTLREKEAPLTHEEMDANFDNLDYLEALSTVTRLPTSVAIGGHRLVTVIDGEVTYADNRDSQTSLVLGLTINAASSGEDSYVKTQGLIKFNGWQFIQGKPLFLGRDGFITQEEPQEGYCVVIGEVVLPDQINLKIEPLLELA